MSYAQRNFLANSNKQKSKWVANEVARAFTKINVKKCNAHEIDGHKAKVESKNYRKLTNLCDAAKEPKENVKAPEKK